MQIRKPCYCSSNKNLTSLAVCNVNVFLQERVELHPGNCRRQTSSYFALDPFGCSGWVRFSDGQRGKTWLYDICILVPDNSHYSNVLIMDIFLIIGLKNKSLFFRLLSICLRQFAPMWERPIFCKAFDWSLARRSGKLCGNFDIRMPNALLHQ